MIDDDEARPDENDDDENVDDGGKNEAYVVFIRRSEWHKPLLQKLKRRK